MNSYNIAAGRHIRTNSEINTNNDTTAFLKKENRPTYIEFAKKHLNSIMIGIK